MKWLEIGILGFSLVLILIIFILIFISISNIGQSSITIIDDENIDSIFAFESFAILSGIVVIALILINIILYWYDKTDSTLLHVLLFFTVILSISIGIFGMFAHNAIGLINDINEDILNSKSPILYASIISIIVSISVFIVFILSFLHEPDTNNPIYSVNNSIDQNTIYHPLEKIAEIEINNIISPNTYHNSPNTYHNSPNTYHNSPNTYHNSPNTYHNSPNIYHNSPNTYHNSPNIYHNLP